LTLTDPRTAAKKGDYDLGGFSEGLVGQRGQLRRLQKTDFYVHWFIDFIMLLFH